MGLGLALGLGLANPNPTLAVAPARRERYQDLRDVAQHATVVEVGRHRHLDARPGTEALLLALLRLEVLREVRPLEALVRVRG